MRRPARDALLHGAIGGLLAGGVVALWFLVRDLAVAEAFRTPARLAAVYLGREGAAITPGLVAGYSVLHFATFAGLGAATGWLMAVLEVRAGALLGLVFGLGVLNGLYYTGLLVTGVDAYALLPTYHVLAANLLGGLLLMEYLRRVQEGESVFGLGGLRARPLLFQGVQTGLIGAGAVALWFFVLDVLAGQPFLTPAALGSALFLDVSGGAQVQVTFGTVALYSALHVAAFLVAGTAFAWAGRQVERTPGLSLLALLAFIVLEAVFVPALGLLGEWLVGTLAWWAVGVGNLLAVASMGGWIWMCRPELRRSVRQETAGRGA